MKKSNLYLIKSLDMKTKKIFLLKKNMKPHQVDSISNIQTMGNATGKTAYYIYMYVYFTYVCNICYIIALIFHV